MKKNKSQELHLTLSEPIYLSVNPSDLPPLSEELLLDKLSHNVCSLTGLNSAEILLMLFQKPELSSEK